MFGAGKSTLSIYGEAPKLGRSGPTDVNQAYLRDLTDKALIVLAKSDVEGQNVFALADQRKASIGQKVIPYIARKLQEQKAKGRLRQQVVLMAQAVCQPSLI